MKDTKSTITAVIAGAVLATGTILGVDYVMEDTKEVDSSTVYVVTAEEARVPKQVWSKDSIDKVTNRMDSRLEVLERVRVATSNKLVDDPENFNLKAELRNIEREIESLQNGKLELGEIKRAIR
jgi:hypothetical protein